MDYIRLRRRQFWSAGQAKRDPALAVTWRRFSPPEGPNSLVPERVDRIEVRGLEGGVGAKNNADERADDQSNDDPIHRDDRRQFQKVRRDVSSRDPQRH